MSFSINIVYADISDHLPVIVQSNCYVETLNHPKIIYKRIMSDSDKANFISALANTSKSLCNDYC